MTYLYIAGSPTAFEDYVESGLHPTSLLGSFFYMGPRSRSLWKLEYKETEHCDRFLLDSGAYTYEQSRANVTEEDLDAYLNDYIDCINEHGVEAFFELDVDKLVGYDRVLEYRDRLESETGRDCIPVWHVTRGEDAFYDLMDAYDRIAIGGINREIRGGRKDHLRNVAMVAREAGVRCHMLGFAPYGVPDTAPYDSVDSTSWIADARFGMKCDWNGQRVVKEHVEGVPHQALERHNLEQWLAYADALEAYTA